MLSVQEISDLNKQFESASISDVLTYFINRYHDKMALASNLGIEDMVLADIMIGIKKDCRIFTLDTGKLFKESLELLSIAEGKYGIKFEVLQPIEADIEDAFNGRPFTSIYDSIENRKACCRARKVIPLQKMLSGLDLWVTGIRRDQSVTRKDMKLLEWDNDNGLLKLNPLVDWSEDMVWKYIREKNVPYCELHDKGYPSIGCEPCTRAIQPGEDVRAGRWWWENPEFRECGLHKR